MASYPEKIQDAKESVWYWRRKEEPAVKAAQAAKRAYEEDRHTIPKFRWRKAQRELVRVRDLIHRAEGNLDNLRAQFEKLSPLAKQDDYWRDRVQDLSRERHRVALIVADLRRGDADEHAAAAPERAEALRQGASPDDQRVGAIQIPAGDDVTDVFLPTGVTQQEVMVFTHKELTEAEARLVYVTNLLHHAKVALAKVREREKAAASPGHFPGATPRERFVNGLMRCAEWYYSGKRHPVFYSQGGRWTVNREPQGEPWGSRSDCSQFITAVAWGAGCPDPNGNGYRGGWTGSLAEHCHRISWGQVRPGDLIIFFYGGNGRPGSSHHVEAHVGPGGRTVGHGSPPVDYGSDHMIAGAVPYRIPGI